MLWSQNHVSLDSAKQLLPTQEKSEQISTLNFLARQYLKTDLTIARKYAHKMLDLANSLDITPSIIDGHWLLGEINKQLANYDTAKMHTKEAIDLSLSVRDKKRLAENNSLYGSILYKLLDGDSARYYYKLALKLYSEIQDSSGIAQSILRVGNIFYFKQQFDSATYYYVKYLEICDLIGDEKGTGKGWVNLGMVNYNAKNFKKAKGYLLKSLEINQRLNNLSLVALANNRLGFIAEDEGRLAEAENYYNAALDLYEQLSHQSGITNALNSLGSFYYYSKKYDKALEYYNKAKDKYHELGLIDGFVAAYKNIGKIYFDMQDFKTSKMIYDSCLNIALEYDLKDRIVEVYRNLIEYYEKTGNYKMAYQSSKTYYSYIDTIFDLNKQKAIVELQLKYDQEKNRTQILSLRNEGLMKDVALEKRTRQRNGYLFGGSAAIVLFIFSFSFVQQRNRKNRIISDQKIIQLEEEKKLLAARSIVEGQEEERKRIAKELHDGLGVLLSSAKMHFSSLGVQNEKDQTVVSTATKLLEQATTDVRRISHNMMPGLLTRFGLFEAVEDLLDQVDEMEGIHVDYQFQGEEVRLVENTEIMLYRIIQEMINNTLKYAQAEHIKLEINLVDHALHIFYKDNGKGFNLDEKLRTKSLGLTSIQSRVKYLEGSLSINTAPGRGVEYSIDIRHVDFVESAEAVGV
jgi:signal transduction histidine kinase